MQGKLVLCVWRVCGRTIKCSVCARWVIKDKYTNGHKSDFNQLVIYDVLCNIVVNYFLI